MQNSIIKNIEANKKNIKAFALAIMVAGGISVGNITDAYAEKHYKQGTFIEETVEQGDTLYFQYVVEEGDNASKISEKVVAHLKRGEKSTKYWPVIAFLNDYPRVIKPGDVIIFPSTYEALLNLDQQLKACGWTSRYIVKNNIYKEKKIAALPKETVKDLLEDVYGNKVTVDEEFILNYLKILGLDKKYTIGDKADIELDYNLIFELTDWIPSVKELKQFQMENTSNTKQK